MDPTELRPTKLYHLATGAEWRHYEADGWIRPDSLGSEGFVHCSWGHQVAGTVERHFAGISPVHALEIDRDLLVDVELVEEDSYGSGQTFPHVYGPIPTGAVVGRTTVA